MLLNSVWGPFSYNLVKRRPPTPSTFFEDGTQVTSRDTPDVNWPFVNLDKRKLETPENSLPFFFGKRCPDHKTVSKRSRVSQRLPPLLFTNVNYLRYDPLTTVVLGSDSSLRSGRLSSSVTPHHVPTWSTTWIPPFTLRTYWSWLLSRVLHLSR